MGHKVHPTGFRTGIIYDWQSKWFAERGYADLLQEDLKIRKYIADRLADAAVSRVEIDRNANLVTVTIHTGRPGIVIGRGGAAVDELRTSLEKMTNKRVRVNIQEIRQPELDAFLVARSVADQLERRVAFRRAIKQSVSRTMQRGAKGIKIIVGGRLGGAEMSRRETEKDGQIPLQTLRADIDYGHAEARTTFGRIGVKVWIYKGEILPEMRRPVQVVEAPAEGAEEAPGRRERRRRPAAGEATPEGAAPAAAPEASVEPAAAAPATEAPKRPRTRKAAEPAAEAAPEAPEASAEKPAEAVEGEQEQAKKTTRKAKE